LVITLVRVLPRGTRAKSEETDDLVSMYLQRASRFSTCEEQTFELETGLFDWIDRQTGRTRVQVILLDSTGQTWTSEEFAGRLGRLRDDGVQRIVLAIGPADGWSATARGRANLLFSLGRITLPHALARVVLAEQVYRALTILAGHPYHSGH
jgi:23S rRNA (pseudouridine1915-N3)-methyltransferase